MSQVNVKYLGDFKCKADNGPTGYEIIVESPVDYKGKTNHLNSIDLLVASVGSAIASVMGIMAKNMRIDIDDMVIHIKREFIELPVMRIKKLSLNFLFPRHIKNNDLQLLSVAIKKNPVIKSLHPDIEIEASFTMLS